MTESEKFMRKLRKVRRQMEEEMEGMTPAEQTAYTNREGMKAIRELGLEKYIVNPEQIPAEL
jgi:hypothetical protein